MRIRRLFRKLLPATYYEESVPEEEETQEKVHEELVIT
jgi:hypothetical protein